MIVKIEADAILHDPNIFTIQTRIDGITKVWKIWEHEDEGEMLEAFFDWFLEKEDKIIVGYNLLKFDIPVLLLKAKGSPRMREFFLKLNRSNIVDLFVVLTFLNRGRLLGLDYYREKYGITSPVIPAERIRRLYKEGKYEEVEEAVVMNLNILYELNKKVRGEVRGLVGP